MDSFSIWHWLIVALMLIPGLLYLLTLQRAFEAVDPPLRPMSPGLVWLLLVPLLNIVWMYVVVNKLKTGYTRMSEAGRLTAPTNAGYNVGSGLALCMLVSIIPFIGALFALVGLVLWITHWVQVSNARKLVKGPGAAEMAQPLIGA